MSDQNNSERKKDHSTPSSGLADLVVGGLLLAGAIWVGSKIVKGFLNAADKADSDPSAPKPTPSLPLPTTRPTAMSTPRVIPVGQSWASSTAHMDDNDDYSDDDDDTASDTDSDDNDQGYELDEDGDSDSASRAESSTSAAGRIEPCRDCDGMSFMHGVGDIGDGKCSACHGTGFEGFFDALSDALTDQDQTCPTCGGSKKCQSCDGKGYFD